MGPRSYPRVWLAVLALLVAGCAHSRSRADDEEGLGEENGEKGDDDKGESGDRRGTDSSSDEGDSSSVKLRHKELPDAVRESSETGRPRHDPRRLRAALCEGYSDQPKIFYHLTVSTHWHYYWICSEDRPYRVSSRRGKRNLETWLKGFKKQAGVQSQDCTSGGRKALTGNHESGIQAVAYCDGRIILSFPDGGQAQTSFPSQARAAEPPAQRDPVEQPDPGGGGDEPAVTRDCPPCPPPPPVRGRCPSCPVCQACPPPRPCPPPPRCPACPACPPPRPCPPPPPCDCRGAALEAGRKAFRQGVDKACKRICDLLYKRCRSINPNTALCYQLSEYCATECIR